MLFNDIDRCHFKRPSPFPRNTTILPIPNHIIYKASFILSISSVLSMINLSPSGIKREVIVHLPTSPLFKNNCPKPFLRTSILQRTKSQTWGLVNNGFEPWSGNWAYKMDVWVPEVMIQAWHSGILLTSLVISSEWPLNSLNRAWKFMALDWYVIHPLILDAANRDRSRNYSM